MGINGFWPDWTFLYTLPREIFFALLSAFVNVGAAADASSSASTTRPSRIGVDVSSLTHAGLRTTTTTGAMCVCALCVRARIFVVRYVFLHGGFFLRALISYHLCVIEYCCVCEGHRARPVYDACEEESRVCCVSGAPLFRLSDALLS